MLIPMAPVGSVTISHVSCAISQARRPAFADSRTMTLWSSRGLGEQQEVINIGIGKNLCLLARHNLSPSNKSVSAYNKLTRAPNNNELASLSLFPIGSFARKLRFPDEFECKAA